MARDKPQILIGCPEGRPSTRGPTSRAMILTASKSPSEAIGNPASQMSTPRRESCRAIVIFSSTVRVQPGDYKKAAISHANPRSTQPTTEDENAGWLHGF